LRKRVRFALRVRLAKGCGVSVKSDEGLSCFHVDVP
jgi:hypothetical protein